MPKSQLSNNQIPKWRIWRQGENLIRGLKIDDSKQLQSNCPQCMSLEKTK